jgi:hypothetical protein
MKTLRQLFIGLALTLALTSTAFAGKIECPGVTNSSEVTAAGKIQNGITETLILVILALV